MGLNEDQPGGPSLSVNVFYWEVNVWVRNQTDNRAKRRGRHCETHRFRGVILWSCVLLSDIAALVSN